MLNLLFIVNLLFLKILGETFWVTSGNALDDCRLCTQELFLAALGVPNEMPGIGPRLTAYKANTLPSVLSLWPLCSFKLPCGPLALARRGLLAMIGKIKAPLVSNCMASSQLQALWFQTRLDSIMLKAGGFTH